MTALLDSPEAAPAAAARRKLPDVSSYSLALILLVLCVVATLSSDAFLTKDNLINVLTQSSVIGILTVGMTYVILTGGIDLSIGSVLAASSIYLGLQQSSGGLVMLLAALFGGMLLGAINGAAITLGRVVPFIATLAMFSAGKGLALLMSNNTPIAITNSLVIDLGTKRVLGLPMPIYVFALVAAIAWVVLNRTAFGRHVVAVGGNAEAARASGIRVQRIVFAVYVIAGLCAGIGALLQVGRLASASPVVGPGFELDAIAAAVIGGTALSGGKGGIGGSVLGVLLFQVIFNLFTLLDVNTNLQAILKGVIILAAVVLQRRTRKA
jgi:ribose transport system permease protein